MKLRPRQEKEIPFLIFISFIVTFIFARLITRFFPQLFFTLKGQHIHHFAYGIILLAICGYLLLNYRFSRYRHLVQMSLLYGFGLGLAFDEFGMWIQLEDNYWARPTYDAIIIISLIFLNIIYFDQFWKRWGRRLHKFFTLLLRFD